MSNAHLSPEEAVAHAYGLSDAGAHLMECPECERRVQVLRRDRGALTEALEAGRGAAGPSKSRRDPWAAVAAALVIVAAAGAIGYALIHARPDVAPSPHPATLQDAERLIEDLGSEDVERRDRAMSRLRELGPQVEAKLREALGKVAEPDTRARIEALLWPLEFVRADKLVCTTPRKSIEVLGLDGTPRVLREHQTGAACELSWSPDGRWISYLSANGRVHVVDPLGGLPQRLAAGVYSRAKWSPDGRRLAYGGRAGLAVAEADTWTTQRLAEAPHVPCFWSPDGASVYAHNGRALVRVDIGTGGSDVVVETPAPATASADLSKIVFMGKVSDGRKSYSTFTHPLMCLEPATGRVTTLASGVSLGMVSHDMGVQPDYAAVSPNGGQVAFVRARGDGGAVICLIATTGSPEKVLGPGRLPAWSPDGARLAFDRGDGKTVILEIISGREVIVEGGAAAWGPAAPRK